MAAQAIASQELLGHAHRPAAISHSAPRQQLRSLDCRCRRDEPSTGRYAAAARCGGKSPPRGRRARELPHDEMYAGMKAEKIRESSQRRAFGRQASDAAMRHATMGAPSAGGGGVAKSFPSMPSFLAEGHRLAVAEALL